MQLPDPHELDQVGAFNRGLAVVVASYVDALIANGCTAGEALSLASCWQHSYLTLVLNGAGQTDPPADP